MKSKHFLLLGALAGVAFFLIENSAKAENLSTSLAGIVTPSYSGRTIFIYRAPRVLTLRAFGAGISLNGSLTLDAASVPATAVGVLLHIDAMTNLYFGINSSDLAALPNPPVPPGTLQVNFLQMGSPTGYTAPASRVYHENNNFYLPLIAGQAHSINWRIVTAASSAGSFKIVCLGYVE